MTMDADGQHDLGDIDSLFRFALEKDADLVVGKRSKGIHSGLYRNIGKWLIRRFATLLMPIHISDLNSGFKLYRTGLVQRYLSICPDSMAFSDVITLIFIKKRHLVLECPISINQRATGKSTITTFTAIQTIMEIINIAMLFNPLRIFLPTFGILHWGRACLGCSNHVTGTRRQRGSNASHRNRPVLFLLWIDCRATLCHAHGSAGHGKRARRKMRIVCISAAQIPSDTANSIQVMKVCQAFVQLGHTVTLIVPGKQPLEASIQQLQNHYGLQATFPTQWLPVRSAACSRGKPHGGRATLAQICFMPGRSSRLPLACWRGYRPCWNCMTFPPGASGQSGYAFSWFPQDENACCPLPMH